MAPGEPVEIDEAFCLDGHSLGSNGLFVLFNNTKGISLLPAFEAGTSSASFSSTHVPTSDTPGNLANDDSSTYVLLRGRPSTGSGGFPTDWRKEAEHDLDADSHIDFPHQLGAYNLEPYQMVDDIAWSNNMGAEYTREGIDQLDETPGFNPDAISRLRYYADAGPGPGVRAEEEWLFGETLNVTTYDYDTVEIGIPAGLSPAGARLTPGFLNDFGSVEQFRFLTGDIDLDADVDNDDDALAQSLLGATRDDRIDCVDDMGAPVIEPSTGEPYQCYEFQGRAFNGLESLRCMVTDDGPGGANAEAVTQQDIDALDGLITDCIVDYAPPFGTLDFSDVISFLTLFADCFP